MNEKQVCILVYSEKKMVDYLPEKDNDRMVRVVFSLIGTIVLPVIYINILKTTHQQLKYIHSKMC
jgi:hypothetical protein